MTDRSNGRAAPDWAELRRRLELASSHTDAGAAAAPERARAVLEERARSLARPASPPPPADALELVSVRIARESYAADAAHVREVFRLTEFAPLPGAGPPVFGVTAWRGDLLLLLDVRRALGLSATALNDLRQVMVVGAGNAAVGILVDEVVGMATIREADVRPTAGRSGAARELVRGVTSDALVVLETSALLRVLD